MDPGSSMNLNAVLSVVMHGVKFRPAVEQLLSDGELEN